MLPPGSGVDARTEEAAHPSGGRPLVFLDAFDDLRKTGQPMRFPTKFTAARGPLAQRRPAIAGDRP
jgi:hypothetical protein